MTILIATGLRKEAAILAGPGRVVVAGGGDAERLERELEASAANASVIVSSGLAGALASELKAGDIVIGERIWLKRFGGFCPKRMSATSLAATR